MPKAIAQLNGHLNGMANIHDENEFDRLSPLELLMIVNPVSLMEAIAMRPSLPHELEKFGVMGAKTEGKETLIGMMYRLGKKDDLYNFRSLTPRGIIGFVKDVTVDAKPLPRLKTDEEIEESRERIRRNQFNIHKFYPESAKTDSTSAVAEVDANQANVDVSTSSVAEVGVEQVNGASSVKSNVNSVLGSVDIYFSQRRIEAM